MVQRQLHNSEFLMTHTSATKNIFLFVDARQNRRLPTRQEQRREMAKILTNGDLGIFADGMVYIDTSQAVDFRWDFFNKDGSVAEMCGNAARCAGLFAWQRMGFQKKQICFETLAGKVCVEAANGTESISVTMPKWTVANQDSIRYENKDYKYFRVNSGVPHAVFAVDRLDRNSLKNFAKFVRSNKEFGSAGTNVTFFLKASSDNIEAMTFERGVEDFTQSCGTGAVAAALVFGLNNQMNTSEIKVNVPGGGLEIILDYDEKTAKLVGEAQIDYDIYIDQEKLLRVL